MAPPPPPPPPRRKPGEKDANEAPRKGRCLVRETHAYSGKKLSEQAETSRETGSQSAPKPGATGLISGIRANRGFFWAAVSALCLLALATITVPVLWMMQTEKPTVEFEAEDAPTVAQTETTTPIQSAPLLEGYREIKSSALRRFEEPKSVEQALSLYGETTGFNQARTVSMEGVAKANDREYNINVFTKTPNQLRQVMTMGDTKVTTVFNGSQGSLHLQNFATRRESSRTLTPEQNLTSAMSSLVCMPLWQYELAPSTIEDLGQETIEGEVYRVLANHAYPAATIRHYFDVDTMVERMRKAEVSTDGQVSRIQVKFSEYQRNGAFYTPSRIEIIENGNIEIRTLISIDQWSLNQGLLPSLFVVNN